jgi:hypothetical protein
MPDLLYGAFYAGAALVVLIWGGNAVCKIILKASGLTAAMTSRRQLLEAEALAANQPPPRNTFNAKAGGVIGAFERLILAAGLLTASWEMVAAVVALKTVARFKELDERLDAEYFLVGSLFSIFWAIVVTAGWIGVDTASGIDASRRIAEFMKAVKPG